MTEIQLLIEKISAIEKKIDRLNEDRIFSSIEEISKGKAAKVLHIGEEKLMHLVHTGKLRAVTYRDKHNIKRYRFRVADIKEYQTKRATTMPEDNEGFESAESIAKRIFKGGKSGNN